MGSRVPSHSNWPSRQRYAVHGHARYAPAAAIRILYQDLIDSVTVTNGGFKLRPIAWNDRLDPQHIALWAYAQHIFDCHAVHPGRRSGIPGPTTASDIGRHGIDIPA